MYFFSSLYECSELVVLNDSYNDFCNNIYYWDDGSFFCILLTAYELLVAQIINMYSLLLFVGCK